ncbi:hypothetical protein FQZ97_953570 [compost metagenome]
MVIRDDNFNTFRVFIENNLCNFSRLKRVDDEGSRIWRPWNNVDLFALQFSNNGLNAGTTHTNAGTNRIDRCIA